MGEFITFGNMTQMRILILNYEYPPLGGEAGVITKDIATGLAKRNHKITVISTWYEGEKEDHAENSLRIIRLKCKRKEVDKSNPREMLSWIFATKKYLKKHLLTNKYDICFANFALPGGEVAYSMKLMFGLPYVVMSHGPDIPWIMPKQMMWYHAFTYQWIRKTCLQSERNYVQSNEMKNNLDAFLGKSFNDKNKIIYNAWDRSIFKPDYSKLSKKFTVLFPGRLMQKKDPMSFLKSINIIHSQIPDIKAHIIGNGKFQKKMEKFVKINNLTEIVIFKPWISKEEMLDEYQTASVTVLPSFNESMSMTTLEALSCGQYLITTKVGNNENLIQLGINGDFIEKENPKDIAEKLLDFYKSKFLKNYRINAEDLNKYDDIYKWDNIIDTYEKDLMDIIVKNEKN
ncbi:MAG: glycosyltransferase family 4 protein [Bacteroidales bacterium]|nr:glycosyltransferase family 4 protein [Bacteroidales bacterium]